MTAAYQRGTLRSPGILALPHGFVRIRQCGFLANRYKTEHLARLRSLVGRVPGMHESAGHTLREMMLLLTGIDVRMCFYCKKRKISLIALSNFGEYYIQVAQFS